MADAVLVLASATGVRLRLRVKPGGRSNRLVGGYGDALKLEVTAAAEGGRANAAVARLLARAVGLPTAAVRIVAGAKSQDKVVAIDDCSADTVVARLREAGIEAKAV